MFVTAGLEWKRWKAHKQEQAAEGETLQASQQEAAQ